MKKKDESLFYLSFIYDALTQKWNLFFILLSLSFILFGILGILPYLPKLNMLFNFILALIFAVIGIFGGAYLTARIDFPQQFSAEYDKIYNDIALRKIRKPEELAKRINLLFCSFFNFPFLNIEYSFIKIKEEDYEYSNDDILVDPSEPFDEMLSNSKQSENIAYIGKFKISKKEFHLYSIPIWLDSSWLGYIGIFTPKKLGKSYIAKLESFEDEYIDNSVQEILNIKKGAVQKQFYRDMDIFSNKITLGKYAKVEEFQEDILSFLIDQTNCMGGLFATVYSSESVYQFKNDSINFSSINEYYRTKLKNYSVHYKPIIYSDPNIKEFRYVFEIPIILEELHGIILLFNNEKSSFEYFSNTLEEIENIKLDNDLANLIIMKGYEKQEDAFITPLKENVSIMK